MQEVKSFLEKNGIEYKDEPNGCVSITNMTNIKSDTKGWKDFWDSMEGKVSHGGSLVPGQKEAAKWVINFLENEPL